MTKDTSQALTIVNTGIYSWAGLELTGALIFRVHEGLLRYAVVGLMATVLIALWYRLLTVKHRRSWCWHFDSTAYVLIEILLVVCTLSMLENQWVNSLDYHILTSVCSMTLALFSQWYIVKTNKR